MKSFRLADHLYAYACGLHQRAGHSVMCVTAPLNLRIHTAGHCSPSRRSGCDGELFMIPYDDAQSKRNAQEENSHLKYAVVADVCRISNLLEDLYSINALASRIFSSNHLVHTR